MRYCINPWCSARQNPEKKDYCQACDTPLLIQERYWLVRPLRELSEAYITEIFEAEDCECQLNTLQRRKVIKVLKSSNSKLISLLKQEAQVLSALSLPKRGGIPQVESDGYFSVEINNPYRRLHCLTMEFVEGKDLEQWLSNQGNQPIDEELARDWLRQIAATLERVHKQGIVHKDIKPSNIMLRNGQLVLIDFGIVKVVGQDSIGTGTSEYMAPEQSEEGGKILPQTDFYALGRTFVHLLTGKLPSDFEKSRSEQLMWRDNAPQISEQLQQLVDDLMAQLPNERPKNAEVILQRLLPQSIPVGQSWDKQAEHNRNPILQQLSANVRRFYIAVILLLISLISSSGLVRSLAEGWVQRLTDDTNSFIKKRQSKIPSNHWKVEYFGNSDQLGTPISEEDLGECDKDFDFTRQWGSDSPNNIPKDNFSARIETNCYFARGRYLIKAKADDGIIVRIGEDSRAPIIDKWENRDVNILHCNIFRSEGKEYPVIAEYKEKDGNAMLSLDIQEYISFEESLRDSDCWLGEHVSGMEWRSTFSRWNISQEAPPGNFSEQNIYKKSVELIGIFNLGSHQRKDGKYGIRWISSLPEEDRGIPSNYFVVRSYTDAYFEKSKRYRARIKASDGFQLFAKHQHLPGDDPNQWVYFTPKERWQYTDGTYKEIEFAVPNDGMYHFHFELYTGDSNAYIDLLWEEITSSSPKL